jgi:hypothetical protein
MSDFPNATAADANERRLWPVTKGRLSELEGEEPDLSATTTIEERFAMMWQLAQDAWAFRGEPIDESPFSGPAIRIDRRAS